MSESIYESAAETAKKIRVTLKTEFPGIKFSVTSKTYSMGSSVDVSWADGPMQEQVDQVLGRFQSGYFDGMQDMYISGSYLWTDGQRYHGAKHVSGRRQDSEEYKARVEAEMLAYYGDSMLKPNEYGYSRHYTAIEHRLFLVDNMGIDQTCLDVSKEYQETYKQKPFDETAYKLSHEKINALTEPARQIWPWIDSQALFHHVAWCYKSSNNQVLDPESKPAESEIQPETYPNQPDFEDFDSLTFDDEPDFDSIIFEDQSIEPDLIKLPNTEPEAETKDHLDLDLSDIPEAAKNMFQEYAGIDPYGQIRRNLLNFALNKYVDKTFDLKMSSLSQIYTDWQGVLSTGSVNIDGSIKIDKVSGFVLDDETQELIIEELNGKHIQNFILDPLLYASLHCEDIPAHNFKEFKAMFDFYQAIDHHMCLNCSKSCMYTYCSYDCMKYYEATKYRGTAPKPSVKPDEIKPESGVSSEPEAVVLIDSESFDSIDVPDKMPVPVNAYFETITANTCKTCNMPSEHAYCSYDCIEASNQEALIPGDCSDVKFNLLGKLTDFGIVYQLGDAWKFEAKIPQLKKQNEPETYTLFMENCENQAQAILEAIANVKAQIETQYQELATYGSYARLWLHDISDDLMYGGLVRWDSTKEIRRYRYNPHMQGINSHHFETGTTLYEAVEVAAAKAQAIDCEQRHLLHSLRYLDTLGSSVIMPDYTGQSSLAGYVLRLVDSDIYYYHSENFSTPDKEWIYIGEYDSLDELQPVAHAMQKVMVENYYNSKIYVDTPNTKIYQLGELLECNCPMMGKLENHIAGNYQTWVYTMGSDFKALKSNRLYDAVAEAYQIATAKPEPIETPDFNDPEIPEQALNEFDSLSFDDSADQITDDKIESIMALANKPEPVRIEIVHAEPPQAEHLPSIRPSALNALYQAIAPALLGIAKPILV